MTSLTIKRALALGLAAAATTLALADEAAIRKNLAERLPNFPKIDEVSKSPIPGLFEVRMGTEILYSDATGNHLIQGSVIETKTRTDLTQARIDKLTMIDFASLPLKDAVVIKQGNGTRRMAVFGDPNCGYCKRFERDLLKIDNVTVHVFLYPILSADSGEKSRHIWCAKDKGKTFLDWMVRDVTPPAATCDAAAVARNFEFGKKARITGTPTIIFADGTRVPGAIGADRIEKQLAEAKP
jgi:thiol:disulfide interchange protein DsbC